MKPTGSPPLSENMSGAPQSAHPAATDPTSTLLRSMRRIAQAIDVRSREIARLTGLTLPQLIVLEAVRSLGEVTTHQVSREAAMSASTVVAVIDKLVAKGLVERDRSTIDRRVVHTRLTPAGAAALGATPHLLQPQFIAAFTRLGEAERGRLADALERIELLMTSTTPDEPLPQGAADGTTDSPPQSGAPPGGGR